MRLPLLSEPRNPQLELADPTLNLSSTTPGLSEADHPKDPVGLASLPVHFGKGDLDFEDSWALLARGEPMVWLELGDRFSEMWLPENLKRLCPEDEMCSESLSERADPSCRK